MDWKSVFQFCMESTCSTVAFPMHAVIIKVNNDLNSGVVALVQIKVPPTLTNFGRAFGSCTYFDCDVALA